MTDYFLASTGSNTSPYDTWANAATDLATLISVPLADGDVVYIDDAFSFNLVGDTNYATAADADIRFLLVTPSGASGNSGLSIETTTPTFDGQNTEELEFNGGNQYWYGIYCRSDTGTNLDNRFNFGLTNAIPVALVFEQCTFENRGNNANANNQLGQDTVSSHHESIIKFIDCTFDMGHASSNQVLYNTQVHYNNCTFDYTTVSTEAIFQGAISNHFSLLVENCDFSADAHTALYTGFDRVYGKALFRNCDINASTSLVSGSTTAHGFELEFINVNSGTTVYSYYKLNHSGVVEHDTGVYRGASDGTTNVSLKFTPSANCDYVYPLYGPEIAIWNDGTSEVTATVQAHWNHSGTLTNDDIGVDFYYHSADAQDTLASTNTGDIITAGSNLTDSNDDANWTGEDSTNLTTQAFSATFTPGQKGFIRAVPWVRIASGVLSVDDNIYFDPLITIT